VRLNLDVAGQVGAAQCNEQGSNNRNQWFHAQQAYTVIASTKYEQLYRHADGHLRVPFSHVDHYLSFRGVSPSTAQRRAITNAAQFLVSLSIFDSAAPRPSGCLSARLLGGRAF